MPKLKVADLIPHPRNEDFFEDMNGEKWVEFLESVKTSGIIEPIVVTSDNVVVSGHQRVRACKELGIDEVICVVRDYDDEDKILKDLIETNIRQRGNINSSSLKMGRIIVELERIYGVYNGNHKIKDSQIGKAKTQKDIAQMLDTPTSEYFRLKALTTMIPELQTIVTDKKVSPSVASAVLTKLSEEDQHAFVQMVESLPIGEKITQKVAEKFIAKIQEKDQQIQEKDRLLQEKDKQIETMERESDELGERFNRHIEEPDADLIDEVDKLKKGQRDQYERAEGLRKDLDTAKRENESRKKAFEQQGKRVDQQAEEIERLKEELRKRDEKSESGKQESSTPSAVTPPPVNLDLTVDPEDTMFVTFLDCMGKINNFLDDCETQDIVGDAAATGRSMKYIETLMTLQDRVTHLIEKIKKRKAA